MSKHTMIESLLGSLVGDFARDMIHSINMMSKVGFSVSDFGHWDTYCKVNEELYKLSPESYSKYRIPTTNKEFYDLEDGAIIRIPLQKGNWLIVKVYTDANSGTVFKTKTITVKFCGNLKYKNKSSFVRKLLSSKKEYITVKCTVGNDMNITRKMNPSGFQYIILSQKQRDSIVLGLKKWSSSKDWYRSNGLVHKIGILLYGKPGTGKSSIVKAISTIYGNIPIFLINPNNIQSSISDIISERERIVGNIIVLIEDFDMYCKSRDDEEGEDSSKDNAQRMNDQNLIFQLLDGVYSTEDTIYIATTNYFEKLDSGLVRYGRFDIQEGFDYLDEELCRKFIKRFNYDPDEVMGMLELEYPVQQVFLQSEIMRLRSIGKLD